MTIDPDAPAPNERAITEGVEGLTVRSVQYPNGPTRCTLCPEGLTGMARLETWLSADESVFVDLEEWR